MVFKATVFDRLELSDTGNMAVLTFKFGNDDLALGVPSHQLQQLGLSALEAAGEFEASMAPGSVPVVPASPVQIALDGENQFVLTFEFAGGTILNMALTPDDADVMQKMIAANLAVIAA
jgi:hypothetical protein